MRKGNDMKHKQWRKAVRDQLRELYTAKDYRCTVITQNGLFQGTVAYVNQWYVILVDPRDNTSITVRLDHVTSIVACDHEHDHAAKHQDTGIVFDAARKVALPS
jgi:hypothetical protein